jgi:glucose/arabinose dehydrogenase
MNNGMDFGPDGALYLAQGAENGYGLPDPIWGNRGEDPLSAAVLRIDVSAIGSPPLNVDTSAPNNYNPNAGGAPVKTYATGTRNPYSVLWHSNGKLYAPVNESANGNTPADPGPGGAPQLNDLPAYNDYFTQIIQNKYYGHPNPTRSEYVLNGGNPTSGTDPFEVTEYPVGTQPNANWRKPDLDLGIHRSPDGSAEYKSNVFAADDPTFQGQILVTEYSGGKDIIAIKLDGSGNAVSRSLVANGFNNPLPIVTDAAGRIYVGEYGHDPDGAGGLITLLTPQP